MKTPKKETPAKPAEVTSSLVIDFYSDNSAVIRWKDNVAKVRNSKNIHDALRQVPKENI